MTKPLELRVPGPPFFVSLDLPAPSPPLSPPAARVSAGPRSFEVPACYATTAWIETCLSLATNILKSLATEMAKPGGSFASQKIRRKVAKEIQELRKRLDRIKKIGSSV
ncbi:hypothetical protein NL676_021163 [Syzygium grande]|nr:hypothetical protein NL676_021163 [Syzygium grande]